MSGSGVLIDGLNDPDDVEANSLWPQDEPIFKWAAMMVDLWTSPR